MKSTNVSDGEFLSRLGERMLLTWSNTLACFKRSNLFQMINLSVIPDVGLG